MPRRRIRFRIVQQALQARARGATNVEAAALVGVARETVIRWSRKYGPMTTRVLETKSERVER